MPDTLERHAMLESGFRTRSKNINICVCNQVVEVVFQIEIAFMNDCRDLARVSFARS